MLRTQHGQTRKPYISCSVPLSCRQCIWQLTAELPMQSSIPSRPPTPFKLLRKMAPFGSTFATRRSPSPRSSGPPSQAAPGDSLGIKLGLPPAYTRTGSSATSSSSRKNVSGAPGSSLDTLPSFLPPALLDQWADAVLSGSPQVASRYISGAPSVGIIGSNVQFGSLVPATRTTPPPCGWYPPQVPGLVQTVGSVSGPASGPAPPSDSVSQVAVYH